MPSPIACIETSFLLREGIKYTLRVGSLNLVQNTFPLKHRTWSAAHQNIMNKVLTLPKSPQKMVWGIFCTKFPILFCKFLLDPREVGLGFDGFDAGQDTKVY